MGPGKPIKTCATCEHGVYLSATHVECYGVPPTPIMVASGKDQLGRVALQCELIRPRIDAKSRACSLHQERSAPADGEHVEAVREIDAPRPDFAGIDLSRFGPKGSN